MLLPKHHQVCEHRTENTKVLINLLSKPGLIFQHGIENTPILWREIPEGFSRILCSSLLQLLNSRNAGWTLFCSAFTFGFLVYICTTEYQLQQGLDCKNPVKKTWTEERGVIHSFKGRWCSFYLEPLSLCPGKWWIFNVPSQFTVWGLGSLLPPHYVTKAFLNLTMRPNEDIIVGTTPASYRSSPTGFLSQPSWCLYYTLNYTLYYRLYYTLFYIYYTLYYTLYYKLY
jgi:hypothetical protein